MLAIAILAAAAGAAGAPGRVALGQYGRWGAFRDAAPLHCFAAAQPTGDRTGGRAAIGISTWPDQRIAAQLHVRLRDAAPGARVVLRIGDLRLPLLAGAGDAWAHDAREDARITAAIRHGEQLTIEVRDMQGRHHSERYALAGAASAIDAAAIGCLP